MNVPFEFHVVGKTTNEMALLDSGAMENFLDEEVWQRLHIGRVKLPKPLTVHNVDGTENHTGKVEYYCWLKIYYQKRMARMKFYLTSLGGDSFILGYPFLYIFNLSVDWRKARLLEGNVQLETVPFQRADRRVEECQQEARQLTKELTLEMEVWVRRSTVAQQWAWEAHRENEAPTLPLEY